MMAFPVNARVGNLKNDDAVCNSALIEPLSAVRYADHARPTSSLVREIGCISEGDEDDVATAVCRPRTPQVVNPIVSAELIFVLAQLALQDSAMLGLPMHHYAIRATVMERGVRSDTYHCGKAPRALFESLHSRPNPSITTPPEEAFVHRLASL